MALRCRCSDQDRSLVHDRPHTLQAARTACWEAPRGRILSWRPTTGCRETGRIRASLIRVEAGTDTSRADPGPWMAGRPFEVGESALLIDGRGRKYLLHLKSRGVFQFHLGYLPHAEVIGSHEGSRFRSSKGAPLVALRPRLADYILKMRRGPQVVYPKDLGAILVYADIHPGLTVIEAGTGSGALTMALTRAVGPGGRVLSCEMREDHAAHARATIRRRFGEIPDWLELRVGDVTDAVAEVEHDRLVLDLPEPWEVVPAAAGSLRTGGVICSYVPTVPQIDRLRRELDRAGRFMEIETFEIFLRTWNVSGRSVRPDHGMVGHTGFVTVGRCVAPE